MKTQRVAGGLSLQQRDRGDDGFTLMEMMIVTVIIGLLIAIGIPTLMGARTAAANRAAQALVANAFTVERVIYSDRQLYTDVINGPDGLQAAEPALLYVTDLAPTTKLVSVHLAGTILTLGTRSESGTCFYIRDDGDSPRTSRFGQSGGCPKPSAVPEAAFSPRW